MTVGGQGPIGPAEGSPQEFPPEPLDEETAALPDPAEQPAAGGDAGGAPAQGEGAPDSY